MTVNTGDNRYGVAQFIVAPTIAEGANYTTIASALTAASSGQTIFVRPGTYTENITLKDGVNICSFSSEAYDGHVTIVGKVSGALSSEVCFSGLQFKTNADYCLEITGAGAGRITFTNCRFYGSDNTAINVNAANTSFRFWDCFLTTDTSNILITCTTTLGIDFNNCEIKTASGTSTIAAGSINFFSSKVQEFTITTSGTGLVSAYNTWFFNAGTNATVITCGGSGAHVIANCEFFSGTAAALTVTSNLTISSSTINSTNANPIGGAGTITYSGLAFSNTGFSISTTTQTERTFHLGQYQATGQPSFLAYLGSIATSVTGNGTTYTIGTTALTEVFDQDANFNTNGTFTAPITGRYLLQYSVRLTSATGATSMNMQLVTSNRTYRINNNISSLASQSWVICVVADMDTSDTATYTIILTGIGADSANVVGGSPLDTYVSGQLIA